MIRRTNRPLSRRSGTRRAPRAEPNMWRRFHVRERERETVIMSEREGEREQRRRGVTRLKFCREPVATVTGKVTCSCGWRCHGDAATSRHTHTHARTQRETESVEKRPLLQKKEKERNRKTKFFCGLMGDSGEGRAGCRPGGPGSWLFLVPLRVPRYSQTLLRRPILTQPGPAGGGRPPVRLGAKNRASYSAALQTLVVVENQKTS